MHYNRGNFSRSFAICLSITVRDDDRRAGKCSLLYKIVTNVPLNCKRSRATASLLSSRSIHKDRRERRAAFIDGVATISGLGECMVNRLSLSLAGYVAGH